MRTVQRNNLMRYFVVLDTNVIVSALISKNPQAATVRLLQRILEDDHITLLLNEQIKTEYREVLHRSKFPLEAAFVDEILEEIYAISHIVEGIPFEETMPDKKDIMFIEVSLAVPGSKIVTGNIKHFPGIENVMTPSEFLLLVEKNTGAKL